MFGQNEIVGKKYFKDTEERTLFVTSMFMTLQGEGPFRGMPAFFIRLAKCNLNCSFCDTFFDDGDWMTFSQINDTITQVINDYYDSNPPEWALKRRMVLVVTGGEPMLQNNLNDFLKSVGSTFWKTQIESNGTQANEMPGDTTLVISPKCLEKNGKAIKYLNVREELLHRADCLKFVMSADEDSPYNDIPEWAHKWAYLRDGKVYISPMNIYNRLPRKSKGDLSERSGKDEVISFWEPGLLDMDANKRNHEYAAEFCLKHGYILNLQIHLYASLA